MGADQRYQTSFWTSALKVLEIEFQSNESRNGKASLNNVNVYGQNLHRLVSKDRTGLV